MEQVAQKLGVHLENVGNKIDTKLTLQELKMELTKMKGEDPTSLKKVLKEVKKDLKQQMKEVKRERKGAKREMKERKRERKRNEWDQGRRRERRARGKEDTTGREWNGDEAARADAGGQETGVV
jgi:hypothetical protein